MNYIEAARGLGLAMDAAKAPAALVGEMLVCRGLVAQSPRAVAEFIRDADFPGSDGIETVTAERIAADGMFCGEFHAGCGFPL